MPDDAAKELSLAKVWVAVWGDSLGGGGEYAAATVE